MTECRIQSVAFGGDGVGRDNNFVLFVPFTLPNELVEVDILLQKKQFAKAKLRQVLEASPQRIVPPCPYFSTCGGCQLQHAAYPLQLEIKRLFVEDSLKRIGKMTLEVPPVIPSQETFAYRRHITLKARPFEDQVHLGFAATDGFSHITIDSCLLFHTSKNPIISLLQKALKELPAALSNQATFKLFKTKNEKILLLCTFPKQIPEKELKNFTERLPTALLSGWIFKMPEQIIESGDTTLSFSYLEMTFYYSPFGFVQNHEEQSKNIYDYLLKDLEPYSKVLDLYCGIGVSSLSLAKNGKEVVGIELNPMSIELAQKNAKENSISNARFLCGSAENLSSSTLKAFHPESAIINPPKIGLDPRVIEAISKSSIQTLLYVSCSPPTLARDMKWLTEKGFKAEKVQSFDMFPQTTHVETIARLSR